MGHPLGVFGVGNLHLPAPAAALGVLPLQGKGIQMKTSLSGQRPNSPLSLREIPAGAGVKYRGGLPRAGLEDRQVPAVQQLIEGHPLRPGQVTGQLLAAVEAGEHHCGPSQVLPDPCELFHGLAVELFLPRPLRRRTAAAQIEGRFRLMLQEGAEAVQSGLGGCGKNCGALTGGVCMISLFAGRGAAEEESGPELETMVSEFLLWFEETYGSADCGDIIQGDKDNISSTCPQLICAACRKALELLQSYGFPVEKVLE